MQNLITQSYVLTEEEQEAHKLEYYIISETGVQQTINYGIAIRHYTAKKTDYKAKMVSENRELVLDLIDRFAKNFVFPCSLSDLIQDLQG